MNEKLLAVGSAVAAFLASLCCLGPLVLGGIGLGAALVATFAPLRPYFLTLSAALLGLGFYFVYRTPKQAACEGEVCAPDSRVPRLANLLLWLASVVVLALALFPVYGARLVPAATPAAPATAPLATVQLKISGMTCEACAGIVKAKLLETAGVAEAQVDYPSGRATVNYNPTKTKPEKLIAAVGSVGYQAALANGTEP